MNKNIKTKKVEEKYPVLALRNTVLFPHQIIPIYIGRKSSLDLIEDISKKKCLISSIHSFDDNHIASKFLNL